MFKKLILSLLFTSLTVLGTACTSDGTDEGASADSEAAAGAEGGEETAASEDGGGGESEETASADEGDDEEKVGEDAAGEDDLGDEIASNEEKTDEEVGDLDDEDVGDEVAKTEPAEEKKEEEAQAPKIDEPPSDVAMSDPAPAPVVDVAPPAGNIPLQKVKTEPFKKAGVLANTVYLGRPEDTVESISQKIFGSDKSTDLIAVNGFLKRGVKAGDKIYYNSPKRPTDETQMMTYFEDIGAAPQEYEAKDGENIRKISKKLLGFEDAWKEVWSTNAMVESKETLPEGTKLRYWTSDAVASAHHPPPVEVAEVTPPPPADIPPPPADIPPPPPGAGTTAASNDIPPPPAPEPVVEAPPPPPPVAMEPKTKPAASEEFSMAGLMENKDTMTIVIGGAVVVIGLLVILAMARKRRTRIDFGQTQV